jgi:hypothetical protein
MSGEYFYFATQREIDGPLDDGSLIDGYYDSFALHRVLGLGFGLGYDRVLADDPFLGYEHTQLQLVSESSDLFVAGIQRVSLPPPVGGPSPGIVPLVSVAMVGTARGFPLSTFSLSCGADAYALASQGPEVAGVHGCRLGSDRSHVWFQRGGILSSTTRLASIIATDRFVEDDSALAVHAIAGGGWLAAYWNQDGLLAIVQVNSDGTVARRFIVPGPQFFWAETFPGAIALSQNQDGTFAVAWSASGAGALQRFTLGCD